MDTSVLLLLYTFNKAFIALGPKRVTQLIYDKLS